MNKDNLRTWAILLIVTMVCLVIVGTGVAGATLQGPFKQNTEFELIQTCNNGLVICDNCTISSLVLPNGTLFLQGEEMTKRTYDFNYTLTTDYTQLLGRYTLNGYCVSNVTISDWYYKFDVTYAGEGVSSEKVYIYIIGLIFLVFLIIATTYLISRLPNKDAMDEEGTIIQINQLKHLRAVLWAIVWGIGLAIMFILSNISLAYLQNAMLGNLFFVFYQIMFWMTIVFIPVYFIWIFYKIFKDKEMKRLIERGIDIKGTP